MRNPARNSVILNQVWFIKSESKKFMRFTQLLYSDGVFKGLKFYKKPVLVFIGLIEDGQYTEWIRRG